MPRFRHRPQQAPMGGKPHEPRRKPAREEPAKAPEKELRYANSFQLFSDSDGTRIPEANRGTEEQAIKKATKQGF